MLRRMFSGKPFLPVKFCLLIILLAHAATSANSPSMSQEKTLTDEDKAEIIKSVLAEELKSQEDPEPKAPGFPRGFRNDVGDQYLSTENIDFFRLPDNLAKHFKLMPPDELRKRILNREHFQCFVFKDFIAKDEKVLVKVSLRFTQYFFGGFLDAKRELEYEYQKLSGRWEGKLIKS